MLYSIASTGPAPIVKFIGRAKGPLFINNYFFDDPPILRAVARAVSRGEKVTVMIDPRPYGMSSGLVHHEESMIKATGALLVAPPARFVGRWRFDHAKYAVATNEALVGTANWSMAAMRHNQEYVDISHNAGIIRSLHAVAYADLTGKQARSLMTISSRILLSPDATPQITKLITAPGPVYLETEEIKTDTPVFRDLEAKGPTLSVVLPSGSSRSQARAVKDLLAHGVHVYEVSRRRLYIHAKAILTRSTGWIGSQNLSKVSLENNREVGIIVKSRQAMRVLWRHIQENIAMGRNMFGN